MEKLIDFSKLYFTNEPNKNLNGASQCYRCKAMGKFNVGWSCMMTTFKPNGHHYCSECKKFVENRISLLRKKMDKDGEGE